MIRSFLLLCILSVHAYAKAPSVAEFIPDINQSTLAFTATQNNAPINCTFRKWDGIIAFNPKNLDASHASITVDMDSVFCPFEEVVQQLKTNTWFSSGLFKTAHFESSHFQAQEEGFKAAGILTIRNQSLPVVFHFDLIHFSRKQAHIKGQLMVNRLDFGIGQGDWQSTSQVKNRVIIDVDLVATAQ